MLTQNALVGAVAGIFYYILALKLHTHQIVGRPGNVKSPDLFIYPFRCAYLPVLVIRDASLQNLTGCMRLKIV
jgi:hypothetical protein